MKAYLQNRKSLYSPEVQDAIDEICERCGDNIDLLAEIERIHTHRDTLPRFGNEFMQLWSIMSYLQDAYDRRNDDA